MKLEHPGAPIHWLRGFCGWLDLRLRGARVEGVLSGRAWMSLRVDGDFLWLVTLPGLRAAWLDQHGVPRWTPQALGRHRRAPFELELKGRKIESVDCLADESGRPGGLLLRLNEGGALGVRFWPRPGVLWLEDASQRILSTSPPGEGIDPSRERLPADPATFDPVLHSHRCQLALQRQLELALRRRLKDVLGGRARKARILAQTLRREWEEARADATLRAQADLLAARLTGVPSGRDHYELIDFQGRPVTIRLDASRSPAQNLDSLYRKTAKAERKLVQLAPRLRQARFDRRRYEARAAEIEHLKSLDELVEKAREEKIELRPKTPGEARSSRKNRAPRLPYRVFVLKSGREIWVGRSAADNDQLTFHHASPRDLWLHAGGVEGSHIILRQGGGVAPASEVEMAARLAARFSKAKHSGTVAVWITQRRHVRKPRKSAPGAVLPQRVRTIFVDPEETVDGDWLRPTTED